MELWDVFDEERRLTGRTMVRGEKFAKDDFHLVVHVCIFNGKDEMLIQQRQPYKQGWSGMWDITVGGSAVAGDTSRTAACREVWEELGYRLELAGVRPSLTINFSFGFDDIYLVEREVDITALRLQPEEVKQVKWASENEIYAMMDSGEFIPYHRHLIGLLFEMRGAQGAIKV